MHPRQETEQRPEGAVSPLLVPRSASLVPRGRHLLFGTRRPTLPRTVPGKVAGNELAREAPCRRWRFLSRQRGLTGRRGMAGVLPRSHAVRGKREGFCPKPHLLSRHSKEGARRSRRKSRSRTNQAVRVEASDTGELNNNVAFTSSCPRFQVETCRCHR